jgi:hypothetical protein
VQHVTRGGVEWAAARTSGIALDGLMGALSREGAFGMTARTRRFLRTDGTVHRAPQQKCGDADDEDDEYNFQHVVLQCQIPIPNSRPA